AGDREAAARAKLASEATRTARLDTVTQEMARIEGLLAETVAELETQEAALADAEATYRQQEDHRREVEDLRRRIGEEAAGRRAEREALERSLASAGRERERLAGDLASVQQRIATIGAERETVERDIEQMDAQSSPLAERRDRLEDERRILAIAAGGPVPLGRSGDRRLLSVVHAEPAARGIVSTVLRDVYLAETVDEAVAMQREHDQSSFVTPDGLLIGPAVIHTVMEADARLREIRAELQVLAHDLSATEQQLRPRRGRLGEIGEEIAFLREQVDAADADITSAAE